MQERDSGALPRTGGKPSAGKKRKREGRRLGVFPLSVLLECGWGGNSRLSQRGLCLWPVQSVAVKDIAQHVFRAPLQLGQSQAALLIAFQGGGIRAALLIDVAGHQHGSLDRFAGPAWARGVFLKREGHFFKRRGKSGPV